MKNFKTKSSFRKQVFLTGGAVLVGMVAVIFFIKSTDISASIMKLQAYKSIQVEDSCSETDVYKDHTVKGIITVNIDGHIRTEEDSCNSDGTLRERFCGGICPEEEFLECVTTAVDFDACYTECISSHPPGPAGLLRSENYYDCGYGNECSAGACIQVNDEDNYGYGYGYDDEDDEYGYGYGYKMIDPKTKKPYLYLLDTFKTYSTKVYNSIINKIGFKMVKHYNIKEFSPKKEIKFKFK